MKQLFASTLLFILLTTTVQANPNQDTDQQGKHGGGDRKARMQEHLGLSDDQMMQMREIRDNGGTREEMRAVFSDEQRLKADEYRAQRNGKHHKGGGREQRHPQGGNRQPAGSDEG